MTNEAKGEKFQVTEVTVNQERFSQEEAKKYMTTAQFEACKLPSSYVKLSCNRIQGTKPEFKMPTLSNYTKQGLADQIGDIRERIKLLEKEEGIYVEALKARWRQEKIEAEEAEAKKKEAEKEAAKKKGKK